MTCMPFRVEKELGDCIRENDLGFFLYFNNFCCRLPFNWERENSNKEEYKRFYTPERLKLYIDVDKTIEDCGLDLDEIKSLQDIGNYEGLYLYTFEVFVKLREQGYTKRELTS